MQDLTDFYIGSRNDIDVIFGRQLIVEKELVSFNIGKLLPIMAHQLKIGPGKFKVNFRRDL